MGSATEEGESPVIEMTTELSGIQSTCGHVESARNTGGPPSKPKYYLMTDSGQYCEGKVKRTPGGE